MSAAQGMEDRRKELTSKGRMKEGEGLPVDSGQMFQLDEINPTLPGL
jgi:hypothetical protein